MGFRTETLNNYDLSRNFPDAPEGWDRGVHPDFKERYDAWVDVKNEEMIKACDKVLEELYAKLEWLMGKPSPQRERQNGWRKLPSGLIVLVE